MNYVAARLLQVYKCPQESFWTMASLIQTLALEDLWKPGLPAYVPILFHIYSIVRCAILDYDCVFFNCSVFCQQNRHIWCLIYVVLDLVLITLRPRYKNKFSHWIYFPITEYFLVVYDLIRSHPSRRKSPCCLDGVLQGWLDHYVECRVGDLKTSGKGFIDIGN